MLNLSLRQEYFDAIKSGLKTVEGRLYTSKFKDLQPGMHISSTCTTTHETIMYTIESLHVYTNFKDMLIHEGLHAMLPGVTSIEKGVELYESFPGYKDQVEQFGALAIKIKKH